MHRVVYTSNRLLQARQVVLATGVVDIAPHIPHMNEGIAKGSIRLCQVCDGYEVTGKHVAVVGAETDALREAKFLKHYTAHVAILANYPADVSAPLRQEAAALDIAILDKVDDLAATETGYDVILADGGRRAFDVVYSAMGCDVRSELAIGLGVRHSEDGYIIVDEHQRTSAEGVYAIGDVVKALNQIAVAFGQAAIAATDVHNQLSLDGVTSGI
jgi:thioredoxin reductase (NADPH)